MSSSNKGKQNLKQSENKHIPGHYNKEISHSNYDTFRKTETIKLNNSLDDLVLMAISDVKEWFKYEVENKNIVKSNEEPFFPLAIVYTFSLSASICDFLCIRSSRLFIATFIIPILLIHLYGCIP